MCLGEQELQYLVEAKKAEVSDDGECADPRACGDLSRHLQTDLHDLQGVSEDHLGASGLLESQGEEVSTPRGLPHPQEQYKLGIEHFMGLLISFIFVAEVTFFFLQIVFFGILLQHSGDSLRFLERSQIGE